MIVFEEFASCLFEFVKEEKVLFCSWDPETVDSTSFSKLQIKLKFVTLSNKSIAVTINSNNALLFLKIIEKTSRIHSIPFLGHEWKTLFTFFKRVTGKALCLQNVFDLAWYESYKCKTTCRENKTLAIRYFSELANDKELLTIYKKIYQPLITSVLPAIESCGLINENIGQRVFPNYHVEGQENGRLSCTCSFKRCYNPHSLGEEQKSFLQLPSKDQRFIQFDFKNMEVVVLAHLADDKNLLEIIDKNENSVYENLFYEITGIKGIENAKNFGKKMFLPVIYGQTDGGLARSLDISQEQASIFIQKARNKFSQSFSYVEDMQQAASKNERVIDLFGRMRNIKKEESIKARNFSVQSPAALLCLESLIHLHESCGQLYEIAFHVHDGYCIFGYNKNIQEAYFHAKNSLLKTSQFLKNAKFNVSVKVGYNLVKMAEVGKK